MPSVLVWCANTQAKVEAIVREVAKQLGAKGKKNGTAKLAMWSMLRELARVLGAKLAPHIAPLIPQAEACFTDRVAALRLEALLFVRVALDTCPPPTFNSAFASLVPAVIMCADDDWCVAHGNWNNGGRVCLTCGVACVGWVHTRTSAGTRSPPRLYESLVALPAPCPLLTRPRYGPSCHTSAADAGSVLTLRVRAYVRRTRRSRPAWTVRRMHACCSR